MLTNAHHGPVTGALIGREEEQRKESAQGYLAYYAPVAPENELKLGAEVSGKSPTQ